MIIMNKMELIEMDELYTAMLEETPELTNTYFQPTEEEMEAMAKEMGEDLSCGDCIHFDGDCCVNCLSGNCGGDIICAEDCGVFEML